MSSPLRVETRKEAPEAVALPAAEKKGGARKVVILAILGVLAVAGAIFGWRTVHFYAHHATTDDAQIDGHIDPVLPRVSGYVREVMVADNQQVAAGQLLVRIDPADLRAKLDQEEADLENAQAAVAAAQAAVASQRASAAGARANLSSTLSSITAAKTREEQTAADLARYKALWAKEEVSQQQYDAARAAADSARAAAEGARANSESARAGTEAGSAQVEAATRQVAAAQAKVAQRQAAVEAARLQLSYATVTAPVSGIVAKKAVEVGQFVQTGQPLLAIVQGHDTWVSANFKETQLEKMHPGQPVEIEVDAYPGHTFHARVDSLAAATGAKFSLLPPDNATGNFTKVVQRVPVKIAWTDAPDSKRPLRVGMNVSVVVDLD
jgi:membrane fusion protein (multidrug efflux system)